MTSFAEFSDPAGTSSKLTSTDVTLQLPLRVRSFHYHSYLKATWLYSARHPRAMWNVSVSGPHN